MARRKDSTGASPEGTPPAKKPPSKQQPAKLARAFDVWLDRGLHSMFDSVTNEPIPEELLRLIEEDRKK